MWHLDANRRITPQQTAVINYVSSLDSIGAFLLSWEPSKWRVPSVAGTPCCIRLQLPVERLHAWEKALCYKLQYLPEFLNALRRLSRRFVGKSGCSSHWTEENKYICHFKADLFTINRLSVG